MYEPKFNYTDKLVSQLIKLENSKASLLNLDLAYNIRHKLNIKSKTYDIFHFAHILGLDISLKDAEKISSGLKLDNSNDNKYYLLINVRNALEFTRSNIADTYSEIDFTILLHLNKLIITSWRETWDARFRNISDELMDENDPWISLRNQDIKSEDIQNEMIDLVEWYKENSLNMTPIIRIAIFFFRIIEITPYVSGNLYTFLTLIDYLLLKNNFSSKVYSSFLRNFDTNQEKYLQNFRLSKENFDLSFWVENFVNNLLKDLNEVKHSINEFIIEEEKSKNQPFLDLSKRQLKVLRYLQTVPLIKREDYCHMMEVSTMTAFRDLNDLLRKKLIKVDGKGRGTKYRLASM